MKRTTKTIDLDRLVPDPENERTEAPDREAIARLADSIRQHGILQRLLVRPVNGRFMVVAGHRRLQAAQAAGVKQVPVEIRDLDDDTAKALQIVENLHREDVTPLDEAKAFDRLRSEDRSIEDVAALVGHTPRYVAQRLSLVNLTEGHVTAALVARLDDFELDPHVDWLLDAILDAARSDSLRVACRTLALKRELEIKTSYGKEKEGWRERLRRAVAEKEVSPKRLFLLVLMQEQGWRYRPPGSQQPALRDRLLEEFGIDRKAAEEKSRTQLANGGSPKGRAHR